MKIRHPTLLKLLGLLIAWVMRRWIGTVSFRYRPLGDNLVPGPSDTDVRYLYSFWHENIALLTFRYGGPDVCVLISDHADGRLITEACRHIRLRVVTGSSTRGGVRALRHLLGLKRKVHVVLTPDGPRGPRREVKPGLVYLSSRTGMPIVPVGVGYRRAWRMRSWDRFALPCPWSLATCVTTEPIVVPPDADKDELERYRVLVQEAMDRATEAAERLAGEGPRKIA